MNPDNTSDRWIRLVRAASWAYAPIAALLVLAMVIDHRMLIGESVWVKPLKFAVSIGLTGAATVWTLNRLRFTRAIKLASGAIVASLVGEQVLITMQAARGVRSHFNIATAFDSGVFSAMGVLVAVAYGGLVVLAISGSRQRVDSPVTARVLTLGPWLVVAGSTVGFALVAAGAHTIGGADGGPGLALMGWSTVHGDLRPAHFVGLHGLQALIVVAAAAHSSSWSVPTTLRVVHAAAGAIAGATMALLVQAYAGQPVTSVSSLGVLAAALVCATVVETLVRNPDSNPTRETAGIV